MKLGLVSEQFWEKRKFFKFFNSKVIPSLWCEVLKAESLLARFLPAHDVVERLGRGVGPAASLELCFDAGAESSANIWITE